MGEEKDNKYVTPSVVRQIINDLNERRREEKRRVECSSCGNTFYRPIGETEYTKCPKCRSVIPVEEADDTEEGSE